MTPARLSFFAAIALLALGTLAAFLPALNSVWQIAAATLGVTVLIDALLAWRSRAPECTRNLMASLSLQTWSDAELVVRNPTGRDCYLRVYDHHPEQLDAEGLPAELLLPAGKSATITYRIRPRRRGEIELHTCDIRVRSALGFWWRRHRLAVSSAVRCFPNYSSVSALLEYEALGGFQEVGLRFSRRRGEGIEFHQLREYREGDSLRAIDWKATARRSTLISREYEDERDQNVILMLDAGRHMLTRDGELSHFDHALNAILLLSYVALRQGDAVGVATVGAGRPWLPPRKGASAINGILNHVYDIEAQPVEVDYAAAATELSVLQRRRSLIILVSNVREEDTSDLRRATALLRRRHLVMVTSLRERVLDDTIQAPVRDHQSALTFAATERYLEARRQAQNLLAARGVIVDDCLPDQLPATITNRYLAIKRAGAL